MAKPPQPTVDQKSAYAALDLGSNSFHMVVAQANQQDRLTFVDRRKEYVRLAGGFDADGNLDEAAIVRAQGCLQRFAERLRQIPSENVRVVGTNTFRKARNAEQVIGRLEGHLGHPIDVISGSEEARLVYRGVGIEQSAAGPVLVVDIGGGSTEVILGDSGTIRTLDSHYLGCVSWTMRFFPEGRMTRSAYRSATLAARREVGSTIAKYRNQFDRVIGSSGTNQAIERTLRELGLTEGGITTEGLDALATRVLGFEHVDAIDLPNVSPERSKVLIGGMAVLRGVMRALHIDRVSVVTTALREGLLLDLVGREHDVDIREDTIRRLIDRFDVDAQQGERISHTALSLFDQVAGVWELDRKTHAQSLDWAARIHEIGLFMGFSGYHKHGAYLIANAVLPGFSLQEQRVLAAMVIGHRGRFDRKRFAALHAGRAVSTRLILLLRVACRLHRARSVKPPPALKGAATEDTLSLTFPAGWLDEHPLTVADLEEEQQHCATVGLQILFE